MNGMDVILGRVDLTPDDLTQIPTETLRAWLKGMRTYEDNTRSRLIRISHNSHRVIKELAARPAD